MGWVYAGVGSRETPLPVLRVMREAAAALRARGWLLRSGGAVGADSAFAAGAGDAAVIYRPGGATAAELALAAELHPAWSRCSAWARQAHARNVRIVLGPDQASPVACVIAWTPGGEGGGGTGQALRVARAAGIPVLDLGAAGAGGAVAWAEAQKKRGPGGPLDSARQDPDDREHGERV